MIGIMTTSRLVVGVDPVRQIPERATSAQHRWRRQTRPRTGQYGPERAPRLIDGLIDRVHLDWPETSFILWLPCGEQIFVPRHAGGGPCGAQHSGYFRRLVLPFCQVGPSCRGGRCRMTPVALDGHSAPAPFYEVDLRSGMLVLGAGPAIGSPVRGGWHAAHHQQ